MTEQEKLEFEQGYNEWLEETHGDASERMENTMHEMEAYFMTEKGKSEMIRYENN